MTEKRFKNVEEELYWGTIKYFIYNDEKITDDEIEDLVNQLLEENEQLKQDKKRLIGYLHRYGKVDVEDIDDIILNKEYFDEWGDLYD